MTSTVARVGITEVASCLPERQVTTAELQAGVALASGLPLPAGMFAQATGITTRRVVADGQYASDLAIAAGRQVLDPSNCTTASLKRPRRRAARSLRPGTAGRARPVPCG